MRKVKIVLHIFLVSILFGALTGAANPEYMARAYAAVRTLQGKPAGLYGVASWYGPGFHGRPMANGHIFDMEDPATVAHQHLPLGTRVFFENPANGKTLAAEVRDRGPYIDGRVFDLSKAGAEKLGIKEDGLAPVIAWIISIPGER